MATSKANGAQPAVINTEHILATITDPGSYVLAVDTVNMANDDLLILRIKTKVRSVGTTRLAYLVVYDDEQGDPVKLSVPIASPHEFEATLQQTAGTGRTYNWEVIEL